MTRPSTVPSIDLVFSLGCPHVDEARWLLRAGLSKAGLPIAWKEWLSGSPETPAGLRTFGSPTILVDGHDIDGTGGASDHTAGCRLYPGEDGLSGVPALTMLTAALERWKEVR